MAKPKYQYRATKYDRVAVGITFPEVGMTQQHFKDECDINKIMARFQETNQFPPGIVKQKPPMFLDYSAFDFHNAQATLGKARQMFDALPSSARDRFKNDPYELLDWLEKPENRPEAERMGLLARQEAPSGVQNTQPIPTPQTPQNDAQKAS